MFKRVLIANRGEIAIRIARAAAALGVESVAVYAAVDALSLHTRVADASRELAGDGVRAYLDVNAVVAAAVSAGCDCVHPGYGFLAENGAFAAACRAAGIAFIGPTSDAIQLFGDKLKARALAQSLGIPVVPGSTASLRSANEAIAVARDLGYPVMLKAAAGGGGRGMRTVATADEMPEALARCQSEAEAAFGDRAVFVEKLVARPRHIEVQILADATGNVVHLHERDCSVQLRNQKVIEMAPAPGLDAALRERILAAAVKLVRAAGYVNAGTVEFLVSPERGEFFFIECNPRIQVEHTITEQVTGIDLVEAQFRIAAGASLASLGLADQRAVGLPRGFAVQSRIVAQGVGTLTAYKEPTGPGVRVDACGYRGYAPPPQFDPLLAKLICQSNSSGTFESAVDRSLRALAEFHIGGLPTNAAQLRAILSDPTFRAGDARTTLLAEVPALLQARDDASASGAMTSLLDRQGAALGGGSTRPVPNEPAAPQLAVEAGHQGVESPMAGTVLEVSVVQGAMVAAGETIAIVTAMKMETAVTAPCAGTVTQVQRLSAGDTVALGQVIAVIAPGHDERCRRRSALERRADVGAGARRSGGVAVDRARAFRARFARSRRGAATQPRQAHVPGTHRAAARRRDRSAKSAAWPDSLRTTRTAPSPTSRRRTTSAAGARSTAAPSVVCADDFTSRGGHADGAIGAKSGYLDRCRCELRVPSVRLLDGSSGGGSVAAMVPATAEGRREHGKGEQRRDQGGPAARDRWRRFVPARPPRQQMYAQQLSHGAGGQHAARQRRRHRRGEGGARPLLGDGARHRAAVRSRAAGGEPRDGLRHHEGRPRRLAHPLHERFGRQPRRDRGGSGGDDEALPVVSAVERLRSAARARAESGRSARPARRGAVHARFRASARRRSTCAVRSG